VAAVLWFRRDLRLADHPALLAACDADASEQGSKSPGVVALFVLDDALRRPAGAARLAFLYRCLRDLDEQLEGRLVVRRGDPAKVVAAVAREVGAHSVHISADFGPYGSSRDRRVEQALEADGRRLIRTGSPYAVSPGRVVRRDGTPYQVFTPFARAWREVGWRAPAARPRAMQWLAVKGTGIPQDPGLQGKQLMPAGEGAALEQLETFLSTVDGYADGRDRPAENATSRLSAQLKYGSIHPRTILARLPAGPGATTFQTELAWREFYADVLWRQPRSAREDLTAALAGLEYEDETSGLAAQHFEAWKYGRTGYPIVDAGMRQLQAEGWMHNRVRMIVASFLVKDLHIWWRPGACWFLEHLADGDLASNNHGWQWVAGTGTDAAPYFRVFNPVLQGQKFDPHGEYVRRYVPELRGGGLTGKALHAPWAAPGGPPNGYPAPIVDHAVERQETLARFQRARG
jgi:deoxyribodipyrimidine photo-lyase